VQPLTIKPWEPGFDQIAYGVLIVGLLLIVGLFWIAHRVDRREAEKRGASKFTMVRLLTAVAITAFLISLAVPSGPARYQRPIPASYRGPMPSSRPEAQNPESTVASSQAE
jgi:hypothetical protein